MLIEDFFKSNKNRQATNSHFICMAHICSMRILFLFTLAAVSLFSVAQDKLLTIEEAITGYHLYPRGLSQLQWLPGGGFFSHVATNDSGEQVLVIQEIEETHNGRYIEVSLKDLKSSCADGNYLTRLPFADWITKKEFRFFANDKYWAYNFESKKARELYEAKRGVNHNPKATGFVSIESNGIEGEIAGQSFKDIDDTDGIVIGQSVHRNEFGITGGLFWSPSGNALAYYHMDESMVTKYPLYKLSDTPATATHIRYPTAGATSHDVTVKVQHKDGRVVTLKTGDVEYLTNVSWTPDEKSIFIAVVNREQNHMWLNEYSAETGEFVKTLFEETNERYVEPEHSAQFINDNEFIWWSERDGYNHLYLYNRDGSLKRQVTQGDWIVTDYHGTSADGKNVFVTTTKDSPLERHLYCVNIKSGKMKKLTNQPGYHSITANENCSYFFDNFSSTDVAYQSQIIDAEGNLFENLATAEDKLKKEYKLGEMELGKLTGPGGDDLYYRVFKPIDFDPNKKYPVVVYLYNGPHLQLITNRWMGGANLWYQYMAQNGYVVFSIDGRGSADRGFEFESAIFRQCGELEMQDQLAGVDWLKKQSWVDADRIGIHGWSYGGYMTTSLMTKHNETFKVGVAGGPVIDWSLYEVMYTERYMDTPQENPEGYELTNLKNHLDKLNGKLLMIHGGLDDVVLWQHSLQYLEEAIKQGVQFDYYVYPHHKHNVRGKDRVHLYEKVSNYFFDNL
jgi:dipeptidyl-peptidase-4